MKQHQKIVTPGFLQFMKTLRLPYDEQLTL